MIKIYYETPEYIEEASYDPSDSLWHTHVGWENVIIDSGFMNIMIPSYDNTVYKIVNIISDDTYFNKTEEDAKILGFKALIVEDDGDSFTTKYIDPEGAWFQYHNKEWYICTLSDKFDPYIDELLVDIKYKHKRSDVMKDLNDINKLL